MSRPFWIDDLIKDECVRCCSLSARGLWTDLLYLMDKSDERGFLSKKGRPYTATELGRFAGCNANRVSKLMKELEDSHVFDRDERGIPFNRRMVREAEIHAVRVASGRLGGNPNLLNQNLKQNLNETLTNLDNQTANQKPTTPNNSLLLKDLKKHQKKEKLEKTNLHPGDNLETPLSKTKKREWSRKIKAVFRTHGSNWRFTLADAEQYLIVFRIHGEELFIQTAKAMFLREQPLTPKSVATECVAATARKEMP